MNATDLMLFFWSVIYCIMVHSNMISENKVLVSFGLLLIITFFIFFSTKNDAFAVSRLNQCIPLSSSATTSGTGADGSNCDAGLICDPMAKICISTTETGCSGSSPCGIGMQCMDDNGNPINLGSSNGGTCQIAAGTSAEKNALSDILCNTYKIATGKVGRGVVVVVIFVTGITFYLGKVSWGTLVAILMGAGFCFGGPAIVSVLLGRSFAC